MGVGEAEGRVERGDLVEIWWRGRGRGAGVGEDAALTDAWSVKLGSSHPLLVENGSVH